MSAFGSEPISSCSINSGTAAAATPMNSTMGGVRIRVRLIRRFNRFSTLQQYSPIRSAPTMRPLPFSVWKERRTVIRVSMSSGESIQAGRLRWMDTTSSLASSIKSSSSSGSKCSASGATTGSGMTAVACCASACSSAILATPSAVAMRIVCSIACSDAGVDCSSLRRSATSRSTVRQASALSSMYQGSLRPAFTVSM